MPAIWGWLVANGLLRDLLSASILVPIMHVMAVKPLVKLRKLINEIRVEVDEKISLHALVKKVNEK